MKLNNILIISLVIFILIAGISIVFNLYEHKQVTDANLKIRELNNQLSDQKILTYKYYNKAMDECNTMNKVIISLHDVENNLNALWNTHLVAPEVWDCNNIM